MPAVSRRTFLQQGAALVAAGWAVPSFVAETSRVLQGGSFGGGMVSTAQAAGRRILVIVQLAGGNDGLNTVIPYANPAYAAARPGLAIAPGSVLSLTDQIGLHPGLPRLKSRYTQGQVAIVQGVGYPNPDRSHFRGTAIWESAVPDRLEPTGWMGRYLQSCNCAVNGHLEGMSVGGSLAAPTFWTEMSLVPAVANLGSFRYAGAYLGSEQQRTFEINTLRQALAQANGRPEAEMVRQGILTALTSADNLSTAAAGHTPIGAYPSSSFGQSMKLVSQLIAADVGTSIFYVSLGGFDTHAAQLSEHASLLATLDASIEAFLQDMEHVGKLNDVTLMTFSEFGRRVAQNGSAGSDHGAAAPMLVVGGGVRGGLLGTYPSLTDLNDGDLRMQVDFRSVYGTVLQDWLGVSPATILGGTFPTLALFGSPAPEPPPAPGAKVGVSTSRGTPGRLNVSLTGRGVSIRAIRFETATNALIEIGGGAARAGGFTYTLPTPAMNTSFTVVRQTAGVASTVPFAVIDSGGEWKSFVGGGPAAF
jgi:uncharacterized protein (DUF1501 family)